MTVVGRYRGDMKPLDAAAHGQTREEFIRRLTSESLTGSAVTLAAATVRFADGTTCRYDELEELDDRP